MNLPKFAFLPIPKPFTLIALLIVIASTCLFLPQELNWLAPGTPDFIQYWAGAKIISGGGNLYDPAQMLAAQREINVGATQAVMFWSPPWFLSLAQTVFNFDFSVSAALWMRISIAFYCAAICCGAFFNLRGASLLGLTVPLLFAPFYDCLAWGQSSTFMAAVVGILLLTILNLHTNPERNRRLFLFLAGLVLPFLALKPHLFLVATIALLFTGSSRIILRRYLASPFFILGVASTLLLFTISALTLPAPTLHGWVASLWVKDYGVSYSSILPARVDWVTPTVAGMMRFGLNGILGFAPTWPLFVAPIMGIIISHLALKTALLCNASSATQFAFVLLLSLLFAPYGWHYDLVIVAAPLTAMLCEAQSLKRALPLMLSIIAGKIFMPWVAAQHQFIFESLLLLGAVLMTAASSKEDLYPKSLLAQRYPTKDVT